MRVTRRYRREAAGGQSMLELALLLPIVLILVLGAVDFSQVLSAQQHLENAAHAASLQLVASPVLSDPTRLAAYLTAESGLTPVSAAVTYSVGGAGGDRATITARYDYPLLMPGIRNLQTGAGGNGTMRLTVAATGIAVTSPPVVNPPAGTTVTVGAPSDSTVPAGLALICTLRSASTVQPAHQCPWTFTGLSHSTVYTATVMQVNGVTSAPVTVTVP